MSWKTAVVFSSAFLLVSASLSVAARLSSPAEQTSQGEFEAGDATPLEATYDLLGLTLKFLHQPIESTAVGAQALTASASFSGDGSLEGSATQEETILLLLDREPPELYIDSQASDPFSGSYSLDATCLLTGLDGEALPANLSPDLETLHAVADFDDAGESGRGLFVGLVEGGAQSTESVSGRYRFFGLESQLAVPPEHGTAIGAQGQTLVIDFADGNLTSAGTIEDTVRLRLDDVPPSLQFITQQGSPFSESYTVTPDGDLVVEGATVGRVSPDGNTIVLHVDFDDSGQSGRGLMVGVREGAGLGVSSLEGTYRFHGLEARLSEQPVQTGAQSLGVDVTLDGAGGFSDGGMEENTATLDLENDPPTLHLQSEVMPPGSGTYTVGPTGELTLSIDGESIPGWVGPDGDTILLLSSRDDPGDSGRSLLIGTRLCDSDDAPDVPATGRGGMLAMLVVLLLALSGVLALRSVNEH